MKKVIFGVLVAAATAAIMVPLALAGGGNSDAANACKQGGWQNLVRQDGTGFKNQGDCVSYAVQGGVTKTKPAAAPEPIAVSAPMFSLDVTTCSVTVPYTPGINTFLYGVNGHPETEAISRDVTVTGGLDGAPDTAPQFWIGYKAQPGYGITNPSASPTHFDFYNGDYVRDCSTATGDVTWSFQDTVTGTLKFNANQAGGSLDYTNSNGGWLKGTVTSYRQIDAHTAVFAGTITSGSSNYTAYTNPDYFYAKVVDGGTSGDQIAVLANEGPTDASGDYDMSQGSGIVTSGNLVVN